MRTILIFATLFLVTQVSFAQTQEYIITKKNDTIKCKIKETMISLKMMYKTDKMEDYAPMVLDSIYEYRYRKHKGPDTRRVLPGDSTATLVEWQIRGALNLYGYFVFRGNFNSYYAYYVAKGNGPLFEIKANEIGGRKQRMENFYNAITDAPEVLAQFKAADDYSQDKIRETIIAYNKYKEEHP